MAETDSFESIDFHPDPLETEAEIKHYTGVLDRWDEHYQEWHELLLLKHTKRSTNIINDTANIGIILSHHDNIADIIRWNELEQAVVSLDCAPWDYGPQVDAYGRTDIGEPWKDRDFRRVRDWLRFQFDVSFSVDKVADCLISFAMHRSYNPVRDYLESLEWDGQPRLKTWLRTYLQASLTFHQTEEYLRIVGTKWMIAAVSRAINPGCKADNMIVLEGGQGTGKSTACEILGKHKYYSDTELQLGRGSDPYLQVMGVWIYEIAELNAIVRAEATAVKSFTTSKEDKFRRPYGKTVEKVPRRAIFIGTTNDSDYIRDSTGGRRYWPVQIEGTRFKELERDVDQLWAEAYRLQQDGHPHFLNAYEKTICEPLQADRIPTDAWAEYVCNYIQNGTGANPGPLRQVTPSQVLTEALGFEPKAIHRGHVIRIGDIMRQLDWTKTRPRKGGKKISVWTCPGGQFED